MAIIQNLQFTEEKSVFLSNEHFFVMFSNTKTTKKFFNRRLTQFLFF